MGEADSQVRKTLKDAAKKYGANRNSRLGRHPDQPTHPVSLHALRCEHVPRMNEDCGAQLLRELEHGKQIRVVQVATVDVGSDLDTRKPEFFDAPAEFLQRTIGILKRQRSKTRETMGIVPDHAGEVAKVMRTTDTTTHSVPKRYMTMPRVLWRPVDKLQPFAEAGVLRCSVSRVHPILGGMGNNPSPY